MKKMGQGSLGVFQYVLVRNVPILILVLWPESNYNAVIKKLTREELLLWSTIILYAVCYVIVAIIGLGRGAFPCE